MCLPLKWHIKSRYPLKFNWLTKMGEWKDEKKMKKKKRKWLLHHALKYSIKFKIEKKEEENQGPNFWKNGFSLRNYSSIRWLCLRWQTTIFHYPFTDLENYPFATPFELNNFLSEPRPRITLHTGGICRRKTVSKIMKDWILFQKKCLC